AGGSLDQVHHEPAARPVVVSHDSESIAGRIVNGETVMEELTNDHSFDGALLRRGSEGGELCSQAHRFRPRRMSAQLGEPSGALVVSLGVECPPGRGPAHRVGSSVRWGPRPARGWLRDSHPRRVEPPGDPFGSGASRLTVAMLAPRRG